MKILDRRGARSHPTFCEDGAQHIFLIASRAKGKTCQVICKTMVLSLQIAKNQPIDVFRVD